ncbi:unnamed protein product, partial [Soboliphyme baturini]|uniref:Transcription factor n=1 Tax=Soboliphyme baturini TaxID=241478 RepID=A0A183IY06_9BILA
ASPSTRISVVSNKSVGVKALAAKPASHTPGYKRLVEYDSGTKYPALLPVLIDLCSSAFSTRKFPRNSDKSKGLRHFSTKVCEKVREKVVTNYNEVADELVHEYFESMPNPPASQEKQLYDQKNIRRRVYDALNVLMAMNIISKEKKEIRWIGLPTSSVQECKKLEDDKVKRRLRLQQKREQLCEAVMQLITFKSLIERNKEEEKLDGRPSIHRIMLLPFVTFHTNKDTTIECAISRNKSEYLMTFNHPFKVHYDIEVLKRLGFAYGLDKGDVTDEIASKLKSYLPPSLRFYIDGMCFLIVIIFGIRLIKLKT